MQEVKHASVESQLGNTPCLCEDTEEMFCLPYFVLLGYLLVRS